MNRYFKFFVLIIVGVLFSFSGCKDNDVTGVEIFPSVCVLRVDETQQLKAVVTPSTADDKTVRWTIQTIKSKDSTDVVASISENGKVAGLAEGFATAVCITNNMFCEAKANIMVGYASAAVGVYTGSLWKGDEVISTAEKIGIVYITEYEASEYEAEIGLSFLKKGQRCLITVDYKSEKMEFSGETTVELDEVMTPVKVSGTVTLYGVGDFTILVGDDPATEYFFYGTLIER